MAATMNDGLLQRHNANVSLMSVLKDESEKATSVDEKCFETHVLHLAPFTASTAHGFAQSGKAIVPCAFATCVDNRIPSAMASSSSAKARSITVLTTGSIGWQQGPRFASC